LKSIGLVQFAASHSFNVSPSVVQSHMSPVWCRSHLGSMQHLSYTLWTTFSLRSMFEQTSKHTDTDTAQH